MVTLSSLFSALGDGLDYLSLLNEPVMFYAGDENGTERCANITLKEDLLVECEEEFNVTLAIASDKQNLILGNAYTMVSITDSEGTYDTYTVKTTLFMLLLTEATFSLPITDSAAEADTPFMTCVMLATEAGVTLDVNITVELNTTDGTGEVLKELTLNAL